MIIIRLAKACSAGLVQAKRILTWVNTEEAVLQDRQGVSEIGLCQLLAAKDAIW